MVLKEKVSLITEGLRNEIRHYIQHIRKDLDLSVTEKIFCLVSLGNLSSKYIDITSPYKYTKEYDWLFNETFKETCMKHIQERCLLSQFIIERNGMLFDGTNPVHNRDLNSIFKHCVENITPSEFTFCNYPGDNPITLKIYTDRHYDRN